MTEELQLSLSGLFYPLDHCDVEFGHPLGVSNVLTEPRRMLSCTRAGRWCCTSIPPLEA